MGPPPDVPAAIGPPPEIPAAITLATMRRTCDIFDNLVGRARTIARPAVRFGDPEIRSFDLTTVTAICPVTDR